MRCYRSVSVVDNRQVDNTGDIQEREQLQVKSKEWKCDKKGDKTNNTFT